MENNGHIGEDILQVPVIPGQTIPNLYKPQGPNLAETHNWYYWQLECYHTLAYTYLVFIVNTEISRI
jgi:hypothetical protein